MGDILTQPVIGLSLSDYKGQYRLKVHVFLFTLSYKAFITNFKKGFLFQHSLKLKFFRHRYLVVVESETGRLRSCRNHDEHILDCYPRGLDILIRSKPADVASSPPSCYRWAVWAQNTMLLLLFRFSAAECSHRS